MKDLKQDRYIQGVLMIILSAFCFACMNVFVRLAGDIPSVQKSFFRNLVAAILAGAVIWKDHVSVHVKKEARLSLAVRCVFGTVGILGNFYAVDHLLLKEKITFFQAVCVGLAFTGCLFVVKPGFENTPWVPAMVGVLGGLGAGIAYTMVRRLGTMGVKGPVIVFYFSLFSCLVVIPWTAFHFTPMSPVQLGTLLLAGTCAAGGQLAITRAYTYAPAKKISIYDYSQIIFATILGYVIFGEIPDRLSFAGYTLIVTASLVMFLYNRRGDRQEEKKG